MNENSLLVLKALKVKKLRFIFCDNYQFLRDLCSLKSYNLGVDSTVLLVNVLLCK